MLSALTVRRRTNFMKVFKTSYTISIAVLIVFFPTFSGCSKEYSCEVCIITDTMPPRDATTVRDTMKIDSTINFPFCSACNSNATYVSNNWSFRNYRSLVCGNIYSARIDSVYLTSGYDITIRGFQDCVKDSQFVINGLFPAGIFHANRTHVTASYFNFLLYAPNNVILAVTGGGTNNTPLTMNMVLDTFDYATGIASLKFFGYAYTNKGGSTYMIGDSSYVSEGKIRVKIR